MYDFREVGDTLVGRENSADCSGTKYVVAVAHVPTEVRCTNYAHFSMLYVMLSEWEAKGGTWGGPAVSRIVSVTTILYDNMPFVGVLTRLRQHSTNYVPSVHKSKSKARDRGTEFKQAAPLALDLYLHCPSLKKQKILYVERIWQIETFDANRHEDSYCSRYQ